MEDGIPKRPKVPSREELHPDAQDPDVGDRARAIEAQRERQEEEVAAEDAEEEEDETEESEDD